MFYKYRKTWIDLFPWQFKIIQKKLHNNAMFPLIIFNSIYVFPWPRRHILAKRQKVVQYTIVNTPKKFKSILILIHALLHNRFVTLYLEDLAFCLILWCYLASHRVSSCVSTVIICLYLIYHRNVKGNIA